MQIVGYPKEFYHVARLPIHRPSARARERLRCLWIWKALGERGFSVQEVVRVTGVPRATLYRWKERLRREGSRGLEEKSRRPKRVRRPAWSVELSQAVLALREQYPRWGKEKLTRLLQQQGFLTSDSTVGRILASLKRRQLLIEPVRQAGWARKYRHARPYAVRKPPDYPVGEPGDLIQVDTLDVRPLPHLVFKHFTARDMVSRWDVLEVHRQATANTAVQFLDTVLARMPFPVKAIQVDGGSEFRAAFEQACQDRHLRLFVLPPHSPKLNGCVERAQRTHKEEFYEVYLDDLKLGPLNHALRAWEKTYNFVRPHHSLDGLTPAEYIQKYHPGVAPLLSHMY